MSARQSTIGGHAIPIPSHVALLRRGEAEIRAAALEFLRPGLDNPSEALFAFGEPGAGERLLRDLGATVGRDLSDEHRSGRVVLGQADPDVDVMLENVLVPLEAFRDKGYSLVRFVGIVAWNVPSFPPSEDFLWFESRLNEVLAGFSVIVLCPYDLARMPARAIAYGALETHPFLWSAGVVRPNPQFIPPDRYLRERLFRLPWLQAETDAEE